MSSGIEMQTFVRLLRFSSQIDYDNHLILFCSESLNLLLKTCPMSRADPSSYSFIAKGWTNYELDGIVTRTVSGEQILLPIWHNITKQQVIDFSPSLADKVARGTATHTVEEIAQEIAELLAGD